jgi:hypothetical protein
MECYSEQILSIFVDGEAGGGGGAGACETTWPRAGAAGAVGRITR